ncbi:unnamed protein product [Rhodiola kirilowii]
MWHQLEPWPTATENLNRLQGSHMKLQLIHTLVSGWHHPLQLSPPLLLFTSTCHIRRKDTSNYEDNHTEGLARIGRYQ